jgi:hypothetical protein
MNQRYSFASVVKKTIGDLKVIRAGASGAMARNMLLKIGTASTIHNLQHRRHKKMFESLIISLVPCQEKKLRLTATI